MIDDTPRLVKIGDALSQLLTIGVLQAKPKPLAVSAWSSGVWDDYYARKALVTPESALDLDYSSHGPIPYTVPELREELGL